MSAVVLTDPAVFRWSFALRRHSRDRVADEEQHWQEFTAALGAAHEWAAGQPLAAVPAPPAPGIRQAGQRLHRLDWTPAADGQLRALVAWSYLDAFYLRAAVARTGAFGTAEAYPALLAAAWAAPTEGHGHLGQVTLLTAEADFPEKSGLEGFTAGLAAEVARLAGVTAQGVTALHFHWGMFLLAPAAEPPLGMLLARKHPSPAAGRNQVHDTLFPSLLLAWLKCRQLRDHYETDLHPAAIRAEQELAPMLDRFTHLATGEPAQLGDELGRLAPLEAALSRAVGDIAEHRLTVEVNLGNLDRVFGDEHLSGARQELQDLFAAAPRLLAEQMAADLAYLRASLDRSARVREDLKLLADLGAARLERRAARLEGLFKAAGLAFVAFEVIQCFPELPVAVRVSLILAATGGFLLWTFLREIPGERP